MLHLIAQADTVGEITDKAVEFTEKNGYGSLIGIILLIAFLAALYFVGKTIHAKVIIPLTEAGSNYLASQAESGKKLADSVEKMGEINDRLGNNQEIMIEACGGINANVGELRSLHDRQLVMVKKAISTAAELVPEDRQDVKQKLNNIVAEIDIA